MAMDRSVILLGLAVFTLAAYIVLAPSASEECLARTMQLTHEAIHASHALEEARAKLGAFERATVTKSAKDIAAGSVGPSAAAFRTELAACQARVEKTQQDMEHLRVEVSVAKLLRDELVACKAGSVRSSQAGEQLQAALASVKGLQEELVRAKARTAADAFTIDQLRVRAAADATALEQLRAQRAQASAASATTVATTATDAAAAVATRLGSSSAVATATSSGAVTFSLVAFNILEGGRDGRLDAIAAWLAAQRPDVTVLTECNGFTATSLASLARGWAHEHSVLAVTASGFHVAITSRYAFASAPSIELSRMRHAVVTARIAFPFGPVTIMGMHLTPARGDERLAEARLVVQLLEKLAPGERVLLAGDFNSLSSVDAAAYAASKLQHIATDAAHASDALDGKYREKFAHNDKLDFRVLDVLYGAHLMDLGNSSAFVPTVPTQLGSSLDWMNNHHAMRLDYVLGTPELARNVRTCGAVRTDATHKLSDHYPVMCQFGPPLTRQ